VAEGWPGSASTSAHSIARPRPAASSRGSAGPMNAASTWNPANLRRMPYATARNSRAPPAWRVPCPPSTMPIWGIGMVPSIPTVREPAGDENRRRSGGMGWRPGG